MKGIHFTDTPFDGERTGYASDIAILQLSDRIALSEDVLPACVRWNEKDRFDPGGNVNGKVSDLNVFSSLFQIRKPIHYSLFMLRNNKILKK